MVKSLKKLKNREGAEKLHALNGNSCQLQKKMIDVDGTRKKVVEKFHPMYPCENRIDPEIILK